VAAFLPLKPEPRKILSLLLAFFYQCWTVEQKNDLNAEKDLMQGEKVLVQLPRISLLKWKIF